MSGYEKALIAAGCEIMEYDEVGSYQGEWYALVKIDNEIGLVEGSYGSCSGCDAFEGEFGWDDSKSDYQERLIDFGKSYLPVLPIDFRIAELEKRISKYDYGDYQEALSLLVNWKTKHSL